MTVMMLGVVQIFAIVTQTAGDAEGLHFAREQQRALFDMLHRDFDGLTREGYLKIVKNPTSHTTTTTYAIDVLAMTTVGAFEGAWGPAGNESAYKGTAAEVIYTTNVRTPTEVRTVSSAAGDVKVDQRKGILGRGVWIFSGSPPTGKIDVEDRNKVLTLAEYAANSDPINNRSIASLGPVPGLTVWPTSSRTGLAINTQSLRRVMTTCTSDFMVEVLEYGAATSTPPMDGKYYWRPVSTFNSFNDWRPGLGSASQQTQRPRAVRVTVATHAPDDRLPIQKDASGNPIPGNERYRGYVLQEVFWIRDP